MERVKIKKKIIGISGLCLSLALCGFGGTVNAAGGKEVANAGTGNRVESSAGKARVPSVSEETERRKEEYTAALSALWSLDQTAVSEEALIEMAKRAAEDGTMEPLLDDGESEYANLAIADVRDCVNVRSLPSTDGQILGKIYNGAVAEILDKAGEGDEWFHVTSGSVEGYIKAEYFIYGDAAAEVIDNYVTKSVQVDADRLNVRKEADITSSRVGFLNHGEKVPFVEDCGDWIKVKYAENSERYVASEFVTVVEEFTYAKSIEEIRAEEEALKALQQRNKTSEKVAPEIIVVPPSKTYTTNEELRKEIVNYAMQFLGNRYISGGNSLTKGTDCSGFTSLIYKEFGYAIGRTPGGQYSSAGRAIDASEIQPGDIVCYSSNGGKSCTHVALYIGDGQIIHSANSRKGVVIYNVGYDRIIGIRNVID